MSTAKKTPERLPAPGAADFVTTLDAPSVPHPVAEAQAGKAFAMWLHNYVIDDVHVTQAAFAQHPSWREA